MQTPSLALGYLGDSMLLGCDSDDPPVGLHPTLPTIVMLERHGLTIDAIVTKKAGPRLHSKSEYPSPRHETCSEFLTCLVS